MRKGKLVVIDGIDGSGKATQAALLKKGLQKKSIKVKSIDFPRYYENFFGSLIGEYLSGVYGNFIKTDPRLASILYAADRFESGKKIKKWLDDGYVVIVDRYVSANQIHQGGKIKDAKKRKNFLIWLDKMEHEVFAVPRPDLVVYLDVPYKVSRNWLRKKAAQTKKKYLKGKKDVAENNFIHLRLSRKSALELERSNKNWEKISCCQGVVCMTPEQVHRQVYKIVAKKLKLL